MSSPTIIELADIISQNTAKVNEYIQCHALPQPSFHINGPIHPVPDTSPQEIKDARTNAIEAAIELQQLLQGVDSLLLPEVSTSEAGTAQRHHGDSAERNRQICPVYKQSIASI